MTVRELIKWYKKHITDEGEPYVLDKNQAKVILDTHKNTLVTARAGSGKTRTVVAKIIYLLAYKKVPAEEIIVFAFNRKARAEINERLSKITYDGELIFKEIPQIATTFHAFSYRTLKADKNFFLELLTESENCKYISLALQDALRRQGKKLAVNSEEFQSNLSSATQFIARAEQQFFKDYGKLAEKIENSKAGENKEALTLYLRVMRGYHYLLKKNAKINFNQMMALSVKKLEGAKLPYKYIFVDEYQDFSLLFLELVQAIRKTCGETKLLAVGDDWQAINRFAGSDVKYFKNFEKYFPEDTAKLFIPTNYRSGKRIVENANYFMSTVLSDYNGCKSGNKKRAKIYVHDVANAAVERRYSFEDETPWILMNYLEEVARIVRENPGKTVKILHRNNCTSFRDYDLDRFCKMLISALVQEKELGEEEAGRISWSTIHRSKGLESDIVILLEIDANKFPSVDKSGGLYEIFGSDEKTLFEDEARLFYVALTRPKEKLYILSKTTKFSKANRKMNFLSYLNEEWLESTE